MHPLDRLDSRIDELMRQIENGEPIDPRKEARLAALDTVEAGVHYTRSAIDRTNAADEETLHRDSEN